MKKKYFIRKKFYSIRKKKFFKVDKSFFNPLSKIIKDYKYKKKNISLYYPISHELNVLDIFNIKFFKNFNFLLPVTKKNYSMYFCEWRRNDILRLNSLGIPEPIKSKIITPDIILVPMLAFDKNKNRLGYGKGFYDRYLNTLKRKKKRSLVIGIAFYFQKYNKLPTNKNDFKLDYIITEKGVL